MYVTELRVKRIKRLANLHLDFRCASGEPRMWTVLVGENGLCKTTLLQTIAMVASGHVRTNQLADIASLADRREAAWTEQGLPISTAHGRFTFGEIGHARRDYGTPNRRQRPPALHSDIDFVVGDLTAHGKANIQLEGGRWSTDEALVPMRAKNVPGWLVAGYGTGRRLYRPHEGDRPDDPVLSRLASLFERGRVIGTGFADLLPDPERFSALVREALVDSGLLPAVAGLELRGRGGIRQGAATLLNESHAFDLKMGDEPLRLPAVWLSQGYQSVIALVADLIGHFLLDSPTGDVKLAELEGLVLIDELDLHLHPRWQIHLIRTLKKVFPRVQFVATTHSPLILAGLKREEIVLLESDADGNVVAREAPEDPAKLLMSELLQEFFGVEATNPPVRELLREYGYLIGDPLRSDEQDERLRLLRYELQQAGADPGWEPVAREASLPFSVGEPPDGERPEEPEEATDKKDSKELKAHGA